MVEPIWQLDAPTEGPYTAAQMRELAVAGGIVAGRPVRKIGMDRWVPAERVAGLLDDEFSFGGSGAEADDDNPFAPGAGGQVVGGQAAYVGFGMRTLAAGLDLLILGAIFAVGAGVEFVNQQGMLSYEEHIELVIFFFLFPALIYWPAWEGMVAATPGKWLCGIRVVDEQGRPIGMFRAIWRNLVRWAGVAFVILAILDHALIAFDPRRQSIHDLLARTWCINPRRGGSRVAP